MNVLLLALRLFRRDWRNGEWRQLALALAVAVAAVTAVGFFADRAERAMLRQASEVLAADLVLVGGNPIPEIFTRRATALGLQTARTLSFPSVVMRGERTQLVEVKAVSPTYPLRGELRTRVAPGAAERIVRNTPPPGTLWVEARLLATLEMSANERLSLGAREFPIAAIISRDSGETANLFRLGPEVLLALEDIPSTGLVTPASRVRHRLLIAGPAPLVEKFQVWAAGRLPKGLRLEHMSNARPLLRNTLERGRRFLGLAALAAVLLAGAAVALSSRRFVQRQADATAILRCLGAGRALILRVLGIRLLLLALLAGIAGSLAGFAAQFFLSGLLGDWFGNALPSPGMAPLAIGLGTSLITLGGFTLPPMLRLGSIPPLRVLRRDLGTPPPAAWLTGLFALGAMGMMMLWQARDIGLALGVMGGALATAALLIATARLLIVLLSPLRQRSTNLWRYGLAGLTRNPGLTAIQLAGFGLGILALLLLTIVRVDLLNTWQATIPPQAPNQFLINIQPSEVEDLAAYLAEQNLSVGGIYPMLRARLTHINERAISPGDYDTERARRLVVREFNLSWATEMQDDNRIVAGAWWTREDWDRALFSVERGVAGSLGIRMHDRLTFDLAGIPIRGRVTSLRTVKWDSFHPNFFVIGTPGILREHPSTYITSFYLPLGREKVLSNLVKAFPSVTIIDVSAILRQVRDIIARGSMAVEYVFFFTLTAGLLVLYAGIQASREHRRQESAILRTLGVQHRWLLVAVGIEFLTLGLLSGLLASACAGLTGWYVSAELLELPYRFDPWMWVAGVLGAGIGVGTAGAIATYPLVIHPPLQTLRGA